MRKTSIAIVCACGALAAQAGSGVADPVTDKLRLEIARTQRDLLLADARMKEAAERYIAAKTEAEGLQKALAGKVAEAGRACGGEGVFDAGKLACVEKPAGKDER
jgi:hypothetical protein